MTNTDTHDKSATYKQICDLEKAGCDVVRITVPDVEAADTVLYLKEKGVNIPIVADIHFDYRVALRCAEIGVDKIRINPGNIGDDDRVRQVCKACKARNIPIRIGVNGGSLDKKLLEKYGHPTAEALVESAFQHLELLEKYGFYNTCVSMKSSHVPTMVAAARLFRSKCDYPIHIGVTETGPVRMGLMKSAMGIGALLLDGIGDTIRVSLTDDPVEEVYAAKDILKAAGLRKEGVNIISCPTCGRTQIDLIGLVNQVEMALKNCEKPITVAVMGCVVNGPGEAREADIGIAGGDGCGLLFEKSQQICKLSYEELLPELLKRIEAM
jgi:(E)-4-hydroxy-3-methylbut-2-enyl-diphosphate synthase